MKAVKLLAVNLGEDDEQVGKTAVRRPHLLAAEPPRSVGLACGPRAGAQGIRSGSGFAETVRANEVAGDELWQVRVLLRLRAEPEEGQDGET